jgi:thiol-disulfide isomerase/thioredoxin
MKIDAAGGRGYIALRMRGAWFRAMGGFGIAVVAIVAAGGCSEGVPQPYVRLDGPAPAIEDAPASRALLVSFWATWCVPCREETPELQALAARPPRGLAVVVASHDPTITDVEAFFGGPPDPALHLRLDTDRQLARSMNVEALPASILIVDGRVVARFDGRRRWNSTVERALLTRLIEE